MPKNNESVNRELYDLLDTRGYNPISRDSDVSQAGKTVPPEEADVFRFTFKQDGKEIDDAWATIDKARTLVVYYDKDIADKAGEKSSSAPYDDSWYGLLKFFKKWAHSRQLSFSLEPKEKLDSDMAQRTYMKKKEQIAEGYYPMGKAASYNDNIPTVKIILQHTRQIQEGEQRYRNVAKIFLENAQGERILAPTVKPGIAQVYARHLAEGGVPNDDRWNHIKGLCEEYSKMAGFVRAVRGNQFNESAQRLVEAGLNHYTSLRESLGKMRGHRGYNAYFESYTPPLMEDESDENTLNELFVQETLDPRIESVMPILNKLSKNLGEMKEVKELEEWADSLTEAPGAETLAHNQATEKSRLDAFDLEEDEIDDAEAAKKKMNIPAYKRKAQGGDWKVTQKDLDKIPAGTRTTSQGLAAHAKRIGLEEVDVEEGETMPKNDPRYNLDRLDPRRMGDTLKNRIKQRTGQDVYGQGRAAAGMPAIHDYADKPHLPEAEVEESGLQAYLGNKKYGKEGMDALRKAGREHAGKKKMASIRAKYDKLDEEGVAEDLDANQKRVGQLGPTEKVRNSNIGKLVGANENFINQVDQAVVSEMDKSQKPPGRDGGDEDASKKQIHLGPKHLRKPEDMAKYAKDVLDKAMDKAHKKEVQEGQEDLDAILRIIKK